MLLNKRVQQQQQQQEGMAVCCDVLEGLTTKCLIEGRLGEFDCSVRDYQFVFAFSD